jgi:hypothetical protein
MEKYEIEEKIHEGVKIQIATWENPLNKLRMKTSNREIIRDESDWLSYNSEGEQAKYKRMKMHATIEQQRLAVQVMDWLSYCARRESLVRQKTVRSIVALRCLNMGDRSYGFRELAKQLSWMGVKISHMTVKRLYDRAMDDLYFHLNRS